MCVSIQRGAGWRHTWCCLQHPGSTLDPFASSQLGSNLSSFKWWESSTAALRVLCSRPWCLSRNTLFCFLWRKLSLRTTRLLKGASRGRLTHPAHRHLWLLWRLCPAWAAQKIKSGDSKGMIPGWKVTSIKASHCSVKHLFPASVYDERFWRWQWGEALKNSVHYFTLKQASAVAPRRDRICVKGRNK